VLVSKVLAHHAAAEFPRAVPDRAHRRRLRVGRGRGFVGIAISFEPILSEPGARLRAQLRPRAVYGLWKL
jgi:hypothetical protein